MRRGQILLPAGFALTVAIMMIAAPGAAQGQSLVGRAVAVREFHSSVTDPGACVASGRYQ